MNTPEKMDLCSMDIVTENKARLKALFPSVFTETRNEQDEVVESLDFERLKAELGSFSDVFEARRERYGMDWPGKKERIKLIQQASSATLKPCQDESVDWETTQNLIIEGDNLEVLKLLQKSYYGKIKMIYIDPPYNTGNEFIYPDKFSENLETYRSYAGLTDDAGRLKESIDKNTKERANYHTNWLNMMYPRLYLARNLLKEDGVIFISIDDNEVSNLRKLCDEIFGEENFVGVFPWRSRTAKADVPFGISCDVEWVISFAKSSNFVAGRLGQRKYYKSDDYADRWRLQDLTKNTTRNERPNSFFTMVNPKNSEEYPAGETRTWSVTIDTFEDYYKKGKIVFPGDYDFLNIKGPAFRVFEQEDKEKALQKFGSDEIKMSVSTYLPEKDIGRTEHGTKEIRDLFDAQLFPYPKPTTFVKFFIENISDPEALILDFFAGSGTTAHAVLNLNQQDGGNRKFILVQLPEPLDPKKAEQKSAAEFCEQNGFPKKISEITKERVRRAGNKIRTSTTLSNPEEVDKKIAENQAKPLTLFNVDRKIPDQTRPDQTRPDQTRPDQTLAFVSSNWINPISKLGKVHRPMPAPKPLRSSLKSLSIM